MMKSAIRGATVNSSFRSKKWRPGAAREIAAALASEAVALFLQSFARSTLFQLLPTSLTPPSHQNIDTRAIREVVDYAMYKPNAAFTPHDCAPKCDGCGLTGHSIASSRSP